MQSVERKRDGRDNEHPTGIFSTEMKHGGGEKELI